MIKFDSLPVEGPLRIISGFGYRKAGIDGKGSFHKGADLGGNSFPRETAVLAVASGKISNNYWNDCRGWVVIVDHGGYKTLSQHLKNRCPMSEGTAVAAGQKLGAVGSRLKKQKKAAHLHFELLVNGVQVDPVQYLKAAATLTELVSEPGNEPEK